MRERISDETIADWKKIQAKARRLLKKNKYNRKYNYFLKSDPDYNDYPLAKEKEEKRAFFNRIKKFLAKP